MAFDRKDFDELAVNGKFKARVDRDTHRLQALARAEIDAKVLTGSPEWDQFLTIIQAVKDEAAAMAAPLRQALSNPLVVNDDDVRLARIELIRIEERIRVLDHVIEVPKLMRETGASARLLIERLEADVKAA